jgi:hypothetical protein
MQIAFVFSVLFSKAHANIGTAGFHQFTNNKVFVETGTFGGYGVDKAIAAGFQQILSVDNDMNHIHFTLQRYPKDHPIVSLFCGDVRELLWTMIKDINQPITFWLDAHRFPPSETESNCPLLEELEQISRHPIKTHTILIDDLHCCGTLAFDMLTESDIKEHILRINPNYEFNYVDGGDQDEVPNNVLVAYIRS